MRNQEYKILSFSTTMRNPIRIAEFLKILAKHEGYRLSHDIIMNIVYDLIKNKLYIPLFATKFYKEKISSYDLFTDEEVANIIKNSPQKHKEAGFNAGWDSRFDTWYKLPMEFGFCYYEMDEQIVISELGQGMLNAVNENPINEAKISNIFLNSLMKYQSNNPFRKVSNENAPLPLLLNVMKILQESCGNSKISKQEIPFITCWRDNNAKDLAKYILKFRDEFPGFKYSDDIIYQRALGLLNSINEKRFKKTQVCSESVDEYIRKMRITKLITLRGNGRFIDLNSFENEKIDFVIKNYTNYEKFSNKKEYFEYISKIDENILALQVSASLEYQDDIKLKTLNNFAASYTKEQIFYELNILSSKKSSKDEVFKFIPEPTRFEFLASIALRQNLKNVEILPNYSIDDEGLPTNHASGNKPDIICYDKETCAITEVSLICGRAQINNELLPITRHLKEQKESEEQKENFAIFVAPRIFDDSKRYIKFIKFDENLDIINCDIKEFCDILSHAKDLADFLNV